MLCCTFLFIQSGQPAHVAASLAEEVVMAEALVQRKNSPNMLRIIRKGSYEEDSIAEDVGERTLTNMRN